MKMEREKKFRAFDEIDKVMYYNVGLTRDGVQVYENQTTFPEKVILERGRGCFKIMEFIVNQDDNDIYEGDKIQEWKHGTLIREFEATDIRTFIREYDQSEHGSVWKVVGNIHDNPEKG